MVPCVTTSEFAIYLYIWLPRYVGIKANEDAASAIKVTEDSLEVDVFDIRPADLKIDESAILNLWQQTWETMRTKLRVLKERIGRWQHAGERSLHEQVCLTRLHVAQTNVTSYSLIKNGQYIHVAEYSQ